MSLLRTTAFFLLSFWLGAMWASPPRGMEFAANLGRAALRAGGALISVVESSANAQTRRR